MNAARLTGLSAAIHRRVRMVRQQAVVRRVSDRGPVLAFVNLVLANAIPWLVIAQGSPEAGLPLKAAPHWDRHDPPITSMARPAFAALTPSRLSGMMRAPA